MYRTYLMLLFLISYISSIIAQNAYTSPCPRLFAYEEESKKPGKWYGVLTMVSETDAQGIWIKLTFDRPPLVVANWYGIVFPKTEKIYVLANYEDKLQGHIPKTIRFYITHDVSEPPPNLVSFHVNEKLVCPEERLIGTTTVSLVLKTGSYNNITANQSPPIVSKIASEPQTDPATASLENNEFFENDFGKILSQQSAHTKTSGNEISCGTVVTRARPLVTHGEPTYEGEFPWHAAIYHVRKNSLSYICGASLINKDFVITAAHCMTKPKTSTPQKPEHFIVYLGKHFLNRFTNNGIQDMQISEIIIHEQYNAHNFSNDIALMKLAQSAEFNDYVRPVCLWQEPINLNRILGHLGNVVGWGFDETGKITEQLMQAKMPIIAQDTCIFSFRDFYSRFASASTYCAGFRNGTSVCNGDSGGGMVLPKSHSDPNNPIWQLRGLVSVSAALQGQTKCDTSNYVLFTDVAKYLDWIESTIQ